MPAIWFPLGIGPREDKEWPRASHGVTGHGFAEIDYRGYRLSRPCTVEKIDGRWTYVPEVEQVSSPPIAPAHPSPSKKPTNV